MSSSFSIVGHHFPISFHLYQLQRNFVISNQSSQSANMTINTETSILNLEVQVAKVKRHFDRAIAKFEERDQYNNPLWQWYPLYHAVYNSMKALSALYTSNMLRLVQHGQLTEDDENFMVACRSLPTQVLPEDIKAAWDTLIENCEKIADMARKAYTERGVEWIRICQDPHEWYLSIQLPPSTASQVPTQVSLIKHVYLTGSLLRFPAGRSDPSKLTLRGYVDETAALFNNSPSIATEAVAEHLARTTSVLAASIVDNDEPSALPAATSSREVTRSLKSDRVALIIPLQRYSEEILLKPKGIWAEADFIGPIATSLSPRSASIGSGETSRDSTGIQDSGVALQDARHLGWPSYGDWKAVSEVVQSILESAKRSFDG